MDEQRELVIAISQHLERGYCDTVKKDLPTLFNFQRSFKRDSYHNWTAYNMLVLKVRGDGRSYLLNLSTKGYFDVTWHDAYHYVLYTRGGPYWQITKVCSWLAGILTFKKLFSDTIL